MKLKIVYFFILLVSGNVLASVLESVKDPLLETAKKSFNENKFVGLSVLVMDGEGESFEFHIGHQDIEKQIKVTGETIYELGSITKIFTRLALASQNKIKLKDPISKFLPKNIRSPQPGGKEILIQDLMTHTGIKFSVPCTVRIADPENLICFGFDIEDSATNPYRDVTQNNLYDFVNEYSFTVDEYPLYFTEPGKYYSYSNVGFGLLGNFLGEQHESSFYSVLKENVLEPLSMDSTVMPMDCSQNILCPNLVKVYKKYEDKDSWRNSSLWNLASMGAAGGLRSSINDMKKFLKANLIPHSTKIEDVILRGQSMLSEITKRHNENLCSEVVSSEYQTCNKVSRDFHFAWDSVPNKVLFHAGMTGSSQSMIMISQDRSLGIVVLSNSLVGSVSHPQRHYPNNLALCAFQLAGKKISETDFCEML